MPSDMDARTGDWMQTFSGRQFWPLDPLSHEIYIEDVAHSLSMQCRFGGHCLQFYSVAEHSVLLARYFANADYHTRLWALLHDASEAYLADVPRPVKPFLPGYKDAEAAAMAAVVERFKMLPLRIPDAVKEADDGILVDEAAQNMAAPPVAWNDSGKALGVNLKFWTPKEAKSEFIAEFQAITALKAMEGE